MERNGGDAVVRRPCGLPAGTKVGVGLFIIKAKVSSVNQFAMYCILRAAVRVMEQALSHLPCTVMDGYRAVGLFASCERA